MCEGEGIKVENYEISVIVVTYNVNYEKLFSTLTSIIKQKKVECEIIIADDGTVNFMEEKLIQWFKNNNFKHYKLVANKKNQGTVKNIISGLKVSEGKFIKTISPGDYLVGEECLYNMLRFMKQEEAFVAFGKAYYYKQDNNKYSVLNKSNPLDLDVYRIKNQKKIVNNYILFQDYILGAALICEKSLMVQYIKFIQDKITYSEDRIFILMMADGVKIAFCDEYFVWYECSTGVSTSGASEWMKILSQERQACYKLLCEKDKKYRAIYEIQVGQWSMSSIWLRIVRKLYFVCRKIRQRKLESELKVDISELQELENCGRTYHASN